MSGEHFKLAISTLSCAPGSVHQALDIIVPPRATQATIQRFLSLARALRRAIPEKEITASLHVGYMLETPQALSMLKTHGIQISSVDAPDIRSIPQFLWSLTKNILYDAQIKRIKTTIGWQFASVTNINTFKLKVHEGMEGLNTDDSLHLIRTSTGSWHRSSDGKILLEIIREKRKQIPTLVLALEIDAKHQTPEEYFEFVYKLNKHNPDIPMYFDLDVGHIAETRKRHRHKRIEKAEIVVEQLLSNKKYSGLVGMISLNQYDHDKDETHISLLKGTIDYVAIMRMLGEAGRAGMLSTDPHVMAEFSPFAYDEMLSTEGIRYFYLLHKAFYARS